jgi:hypothetical protein
MDDVFFKEFKGTGDMELRLRRDLAKADLAHDSRGAVRDPPPRPPTLPPGHRRRLNVQASWPWAADIVTAWERVSALPQAP